MNHGETGVLSGSGGGTPWTARVGGAEFRLRALQLALVILLVPACGQASKEPAELASDEFFSFPNGNWVNPSPVTGAGAITLSPGMGNPAPSLEFSTAGVTAAGTCTVTGVNSWNAPITFAIQEALTGTAATNGAGGDSAEGIIQIMDAANAVVAFADWNNANDTITFSINGVTGAVPPAPAAAPPPDGSFTFLQFSVDSQGNANWVQGGVTVQTANGFPVGPFHLQLVGNFSGAQGTPAIFFDDLIVSTGPAPGQ